jgi:hypothetical protein
MCPPGWRTEYVANECCPTCKPPSILTPPPQKSQKCKEVMEDNDDFIDLRVSIKPEDKGEPEDLRPLTGKGWSVKESDKPTITLVTSTNDDMRAGTIETLQVIGNVKTVTIEYTTSSPSFGKPALYRQYNKGQPIHVESGQVVFVNPTDSTKTGLQAFSVLVTVVSAIKPELPLNMKLKVFACVEDIPEPCTDWELVEFACTEIMKVPGELADKRITLIPSGKPSDIRPSGKGWTVPSTEKPVITVSLASADGRKPGLLEKIVLTGNVKTVKIEVLTLESPTYKNYNKGDPITLKAGLVTFTNEITKKAGILVKEVRVTVLSPVDEKKSYNIKMEVFACVQDEPKPEDDEHEPENIGCIDIMHDPEELPDKRIVLDPPNKGTPSDLRPSGKGWPVNPADKPSVTINLTTPDGKKPGLLKKIDIPGNVKTVKVDLLTIRPRDHRKIKPSDKVTPEGFTPFNDGKPVPVDQLPIIFKDEVTQKPGIMVYQVKLTFVEPKDPTKPLQPTLKVHACIQNDLVIITKTELQEILEFEQQLKADKHHHA